MADVIDMSQYLDLFLQEAEEQLAILEQETLRLERDPSPERLGQIFRAAHTLKGSSGAMGFGNLARLTHEMESLLDSLRSGRLGLTTRILDALLMCVDCLGETKESIISTGSDQYDNSDVVKVLQGLNGVMVEPASVEKESGLAEETWTVLRETSRHQAVFEARFRLLPDCIMKFARAFMAISVVENGGELYASIPDAEVLEEEKFDSEFILYFHHPMERDELQKEFEKIGELESVVLNPVSDTTEQPKLIQAAPAPVADSPETTANVKREVAQTVRVDVSRLDELMNLVGELVIDRTRLSQIGATLTGKFDLDHNIEALAETIGHLGRITSDLQDILLKARMTPIEMVFNRLPRSVRDLAHAIGKEIQLDLVGGETEMDRSIIEVISDPLLHILRNSVDHGIEMPDVRKAKGKPVTGSIVVAAKHEEGHIIIEVSDDGKGIDVNRVRAKAVETGLLNQEAADRLSDQDALGLIFSNGLSTAEKVTDVSGRGVGMDIVRSNIQRLGGLIDVTSVPGQGTTFRLRLPLTLAIIRGLIVQVRDVVYVLPLSSVVETLSVPPDQVQTVGGQNVILLRGSTTPLVDLGELFSSDECEPKRITETKFVVVVGVAEKRVGIVVDKLVGEQEVVIKSLSRYCGDIRGISGATILGNGRVALIADVNGMLTLARNG